MTDHLALDLRSRLVDIWRLVGHPCMLIERWELHAALAGSGASAEAIDAAIDAAVEDGILREHCLLGGRFDRFEVAGRRPGPEQALRRSVEAALDLVMDLRDWPTHGVSDLHQLVDQVARDRWGWLADVTIPDEPPPSSRPRKAPIPKALRAQVYERDGHACVDCGTTTNLTCDHVHPESLGGPTTLDNLATRCRSCNSRKGTKVLAP